MSDYISRQTAVVKAELLNDGTMFIQTDLMDKVGRVIVQNGRFCKEFYQDEQRLHKPTGGIKYSLQ